MLPLIKAQNLESVLYRFVPSMLLCYIVTDNDALIKKKSVWCKTSHCPVVIYVPIIIMFYSLKSFWGDLFECKGWITQGNYSYSIRESCLAPKWLFVQVQVAFVMDWSLKVTFSLTKHKKRKYDSAPGGFALFTPLLAYSSLASSKSDEVKALIQHVLEDMCTCSYPAG